MTAATRAGRYVDQNTKRRLRRAIERAARDAMEAAITLEAVARAQTRQREIRVLRLPGGVLPLGVFAGTDTMHPPVPDPYTGSSCLACFGWTDDYRHTHRLWLDRTVRRG